MPLAKGGTGARKSKKGTALHPLLAFPRGGLHGKWCGYPLIAHHGKALGLHTISFCHPRALGTLGDSMEWQSTTFYE